MDRQPVTSCQAGSTCPRSALTEAAAEAQRLIEEMRRFYEEHSTWSDTGAAEHFLSETARDGISIAIRRLNGLYVRHLPGSSAVPTPGHLHPASTDIR